MSSRVTPHSGVYFAAGKDVFFREAQSMDASGKLVGMQQEEDPILHNTKVKLQSFVKVVKATETSQGCIALPVTCAGKKPPSVILCNDKIYKPTDTYKDSVILEATAPQAAAFGKLGAFGVVVISGQRHRG